MTNAALAIACIVYAAVYIIHSRFNFNRWPLWKQSITYALGVLSTLTIVCLIMFRA